MNCKNCGAELNEGAVFCGNCGSKVQTGETVFEIPGQDYQHETYNSYQEQGYYQPPVIPEYPSPSAYVPAEKPNTVLWIVLSAIETLICCSGIGNILGTVSLVFSILGHVAAEKNDFADAEKKIKVAKICFWVGLGLCLIFLAIYFILVAVGVAAGVTEEYLYY